MNPKQNNSMLNDQEKEDFITRLEARAARAEGREEDKYWFVSKAKAMMPVNEWLKVLQRESMRSHAPGEEPTALIVGENGSGKEGIARMIHAGSKRANGAWISVNCANFNEEELEAEFFGAGEKAKGAFELAKGGTIFIDEIDAMTQKIQAQVAVTLETGSFRARTGRAVIVDVRAIAATSQNLAQSISQGTFSENLYHRVSRVTIEVPALRSRMEDIIPMCEQFLARAFHARGKKFDGLSSEAKSALQNYVWPGNVSELLCVVERTALLWTKSGKVGEDDVALPKTSSEFNENYRPGVKLRLVTDDFTFTHLKKQWTNEFEREYLENLLSNFQGNVTAAAKKSGIDRSNLLRLMRRHLISARNYRAIKDAA